MAAIRARMPDDWPCPICKHRAWQLESNGPIVLQIQDQEGFHVFAPEGLVCVALQCTNCGNTHLFDLQRLGLDDIVKRHFPQSSPTVMEWRE